MKGSVAIFTWHLVDLLELGLMVTKMNALRQLHLQLQTEGQVSVPRKPAN